MNITKREEVIDAVANAYEPRVLALLSALKDDLMLAGFDVTDPYEMHDEEYQWCLTVRRHEDADYRDFGVDIRLEIPEAKTYGDDEASEGFGISFGIAITAIDGLVLGGLQPYNYTDDCWIDARDEEEVEGRFGIIESADTGEAVALVESYLNKPEEAA